MSTRPAKSEAESGAGQAALSGHFGTPWGRGLATVQGGRLVEVELPPLRARAETHREETGDVYPGERALIDYWVRELESYFRGERLSWRADEIGLDGWSLNDFTRAVYETLLGVPPGLTVSYGVLAQMAGFPRAARAVGTAMANNPIPIVVPCHRVIRSDGSLGRYGEDPKWKERLLAHERRFAGQGGR